MNPCPNCLTDRAEKELIQGICFKCGRVSFPDRFAKRLDKLASIADRKDTKRRYYLKNREAYLQRAAAQRFAKKQKRSQEYYQEHREFLLGRANDRYRRRLTK